MTTKFWDWMSRRYDDDIKKHDAEYEDTVRAAMDQVSDSDVVLDFACASGELTLAMAARVKRVQGIDASARMIELAQAKASDRHATNVSFAEVDEFHATLDDQSFSAIAALNIIHLVKDPGSSLARLHDLLEPGGVLISQTPCLGEWNWFVRFLIRVVQSLWFAPSIHHLRFAELEGLVAVAGFEIVESRTCNEADRIRRVVARRR